MPNLPEIHAQMREASRNLGATDIASSVPMHMPGKRERIPVQKDTDDMIFQKNLVMSGI